MDRKLLQKGHGDGRWRSMIPIINAQTSPHGAQGPSQHSPRCLSSLSYTSPLHLLTFSCSLILLLLLFSQSLAFLMLFLVHNILIPSKVLLMYFKTYLRFYLFSWAGFPTVPVPSLLRQNSSLPPQRAHFTLFGPTIPWGVSLTKLWVPESRKLSHKFSCPWHLLHT